MANYNFINNRGVIVADTSSTRAIVNAEFRAAFGEDMPTDPATPQGALITRIVEERDAVARNNVELANQINPALAGGIFLDALIVLTGGERRSCSKSVINGAIFSGVPGTIIPTGSLVETESGIQFETTKSIVLGTDGKSIGSLVAVDYGPIYIPANSLKSVASSVLGWETISNPFASSVGTNDDSDVKARRLRSNTLALQTISINEAIKSRLYNIPTVRSLQYLENYADIDRTVEGIAMRKHSIWVCVDGGKDEEVAQELFDTKTVGGGYNGAVIVTIIDKINGYPYPIKFDRPVEIPILIKVTVRENQLDVRSLIPNLIMNYVNGEVDGDISFIVGKDISTFEIAGAINQQEPSIFIKKIELSTVGGMWSSDTMKMAINEVARTQISSISVVIE